MKSLKDEVLKHHLLAVIRNYYPEDKYSIHASLTEDLVANLSYYHQMAHRRSESQPEAKEEGFITPRPTSSHFGDINAQEDNS